MRTVSCANLGDCVHVQVHRRVCSMLLGPFLLSYFSPTLSPCCNHPSLVRLAGPFPKSHFSTNGWHILQREAKLNARNYSHVLPPWYRDIPVYPRVYLIYPCIPTFSGFYRKRHNAVKSMGFGVRKKWTCFWLCHCSCVTLNSFLKTL